MSVEPDPEEEQVRSAVASACRILAHRGLVTGTLGHVSGRVGPDRMVIRCRGPREEGLAGTRSEDVRRADLDGCLAGGDEGWSAPKEYPIHTELYRARPDVGAVVHAHPMSALLCGLAGLQPRPVFGAYNIPAMRMALDGVPVYLRPVLITRPPLAHEMLAAMGNRQVCLLRGHGITVAAPTVEAATVAAINLDQLLSVTLSLAQLGAEPPNIEDRDLAELPDLGSGFNDRLAWSALVAEERGGPT